jgi:hypothetical protein
MHGQGTRPDLQHQSGKWKLAGVSCISLCMCWCYMWVEGEIGQESGVHICTTSTLEGSLLFCTLRATQNFSVFGTSRFTIAAQTPYLCPQNAANTWSLECPSNQSYFGESKQRTKFCTGGRELRDSGALPVGLSSFKLHPVVHHPVEKRKLGDIAWSQVPVLRALSTTWQ